MTGQVEYTIQVADTVTVSSPGVPGPQGPTAVTLAGLDYLTLSGQEITAGQLVPTTDVDIESSGAGFQMTVNEAASAVEWGLASKYLSCRKGSAGTITKFEPVYVSGYNVGQATIEVELADQAAASTMPAVGLAFDTITNSTGGRVLMIGLMTDVDTSSYSVGDSLYVANGGGLTATRPTSGPLQAVARVMRSNVSNGSVVVQGAGRTNDVPHFTAADTYWYGGTSGQVTEGTITAAGRAILDDADALAQRTTLFADLPTSDPLVAGQLWNDNTTLRVSAG